MTVIGLLMKALRGNLITITCMKTGSVRFWHILLLLDMEAVSGVHLRPARNSLQTACCQNAGVVYQDGSHYIKVEPAERRIQEKNHIRSTMHLRLQKLWVLMRFLMVSQNGREFNARPANYLPVKLFPIYRLEESLKKGE